MDSGLGAAAAFLWRRPASKWLHLACKPILGDNSKWAAIAPLGGQLLYVWGHFKAAD